MNGTRRSLALALQALGDTADEVADFLLAGGYHGFRHTSTDCPLAKYLCAVVPDATWAAVGESTVMVRTDDRIEVDVEADLTPAASDFVIAFDLGAYPDLYPITGDDEPDE